VDLPSGYPQSESVLESLLRVLLEDHGLRPPHAQYVVRDERRRFVARADFAYPRERLLVEADGRAWHDAPDRRDDDRRKANAFERLGWRLLRFTWADVVHRPG
jgi:very-short-patch-repair endonuclease